jgi:hypothetical protein
VAEGKSTNVLRTISVIIIRGLEKREMFLEMLVYSPVNHLVQQVVQKSFSALSDYFI